MTSEEEDLADYRLRARRWLVGNLDRRADPVVRPYRPEKRSPEDVAKYRSLQRSLFEAGYAGISFPVAYRGQGLSQCHEQIFRDESAPYEVPKLGGSTFGPVARSMLAHASDDFLRRHIPPMLSGDAIWCQFFSEPEAGSDLAGVRTTARRDGDNWVISGSKMWTTGAYYADWAMCLARTDWTAPKHHGLTWFALPTDTAGVSIHHTRQFDGDSGFCHEFLDEVIVSDEDRIGEINRGWEVAQTMLVYERGGGAPIGAGASSRLRELAPDLVSLARQAGRLDEPAVRQLIGRAHVNDYALAQLERHLAARLKDGSSADPAIASYAKLASGTYAPLRAQIALEIAGSDALYWGTGELGEVARTYFGARAVAVAGGTNEMQRNSIGERVLGLPREPSIDRGVPFFEVVRRATACDGQREEQANG